VLSVEQQHIPDELQEKYEDVVRLKYQPSFARVWYWRQTLGILIRAKPLRWILAMAVAALVKLILHLL
jgi:hypothetical protein